MSHTPEGLLAISRSRKGVPPGNKGKKAMHKDGITKHFSEEEIPIKISEGWEMGSTRVYKRLTYSERQYIRQRTIEGMNESSVRKKVLSAVEHNTEVLSKNRHKEGEVTKSESIAKKILCPLGFIYNKNLCINDITFPYRPDFIHHDLKIIIEIDGSSHLGESSRIRDNMKDTMMVSLGYNVYRFKNNFVIEDTDYFIKDINIILNGGDINECVGLYDCKTVSANM